MRRISKNSDIALDLSSVRGTSGRFVIFLYTVNPEASRIKRTDAQVVTDEETGKRTLPLNWSELSTLDSGVLNYTTNALSDDADYDDGVYNATFTGSTVYYIDNEGGGSEASLQEQIDALDIRLTDNEALDVQQGADITALDGRVTYLEEHPYDDTEIRGEIAAKQDALTFDSAPTQDSDNPVKSGGVYTALSGKQDALTFDSAPTQDSDNPVKSGGVYTALSGKQDTLVSGTSIKTLNNQSILGSGNVTVVTGVTWDGNNTVNNNGVSVLHTPRASDISGPFTVNNARKDNVSDAIVALNTYCGQKQDTLTFDNAPTQNSDNPVKSGGVYTAIEEEAGRRSEVASAALTQLRRLIGQLDARITVLENTVPPAYDDTEIRQVTSEALTELRSIIYDNEDVTAASLTSLRALLDGVDESLTSLGGRMTQAETDITTLDTVMSAAVNQLS